MLCPVCGKEIEAGSIFCPKCGVEVDKYAVAPIGQPVKAVKTRGFFASLFDSSFSEFITPKIIKFLYTLAHTVSALLALAAITIGFEKSTTTGIAALVFSPLIYLLSVILIRIWFEIIIVIFHIGEDIRNIARKE